MRVWQLWVNYRDKKMRIYGRNLPQMSMKLFFFTMAQQPPSGPRPPHYREFTITLRHTTFGRTHLDEWSARRRHLYLTTHNTHKRQTSMPPAGFQLTIPASERPQTHALDRTATGIDYEVIAGMKNRATAAKMQTCLQLHTSPLRILYHQPEDDTLTLRRLMSCIYGVPILDVSRSHTTTQHSR